MTVAQRDFLQRRVEAFHTMLLGAGSDSAHAGWIKRRGASREGIAALDVAMLVTPPARMEVGYVPIVLYEGLERPSGCQAEPPPPPRPPPPPPSPPTPVCPARKPAPNNCEERCVAAGHCCVGTVSSGNTTSCAQGCIIATHTRTTPECQAVCRLRGLPYGANATCEWSIGGSIMSNCGVCPEGCDAEDGPNECEAGCVFGRK